ncbi:DUF4129 domain-containing protein [Flavihumibacter sp. CACIAM 22H1]|uniref:DUF4129 domain-containing protein n=1 Tax=Flavihumibacter sp. CACIAM 22H1 TaxID=1812911 RepID=UPI000A647DE8|nr:DUF4129 domain-containing protein [Flavihumibacter sp. CACIAM 22H1]
MDSTKLDSIKNLEVFAYANDPAYWKKNVENNQQPEQENWFDALIESWGFKLVVYIVVAALLIFAAFRLLNEQNMLLFSRKTVKRRKLTNAEEQQHEPGIEELLKKAEYEQDFREAVRLQYLSVLFLLRDKSLVEYHPEWTNATYLRLLRTHPCFPAFRNLTRIYDFVYYGGFETDEVKYRQIQQEFSLFRKKL